MEFTSVVSTLVIEGIRSRSDSRPISGLTSYGVATLHRAPPAMNSWKCVDIGLSFHWINKQHPYITRHTPFLGGILISATSS